MINRPLACNKEEAIYALRRLGSMLLESAPHNKDEVKVQMGILWNMVDSGEYDKPITDPHVYVRG